MYVWTDANPCIYESQNSDDTRCKKYEGYNPLDLKTFYFKRAIPCDKSTLVPITNNQFGGPLNLKNMKNRFKNVQIPCQQF